MLSLCLGDEGLGSEFHRFLGCGHSLEKLKDAFPPRPCAGKWNSRHTRDLPGYVWSQQIQQGVKIVAAYASPRSLHKCKRGFLVHPASLRLSNLSYSSDLASLRGETFVAVRSRGHVFSRQRTLELTLAIDPT